MTGEVGGMGTAGLLGVVAPTLGFLVASLVLAEVCARSGLFAWAAGVVARGSGGRPGALLCGTLLTGLASTTLLGLDATVLLMTPLVIRAAAGLRLDPRPVAGACLRVANSGSLLLPVANLTNLLAVPSLALGATQWLLLLAPAQAAILAVEYAVLRRGAATAALVPVRAEATPPPAAPRDEASPPSPLPPRPLPQVPAVALGALLLGVLVASRLGVHPWVPAAAVAAATAAWALVRRISTPPSLLRAALPGPALALLAWATVAVAVAEGPAAGPVHAVVAPVVHLAGAGPGGALGLLALAALGTAASALLSNIAAALVLVPLVAPAGTASVLGLLIGLDAGAGLTWTGSIATVLWARVLASEGLGVRPLRVHRWWLPATAGSVVVGSLVLAATAAVVGL